MSRAAAQDGDDRVQQLYSKAQADEKEGRLGQATEDYLEMIRLRPRLAAAHNNLGRLYYQQGKLSEAVESLSNACKLDPKLAPPRALLGFVLFQMGDFSAARRELETATKLNPRDSNTKLFLARSMIELQELKGALTVLEKLQGEDPNNPEVLFTLGGVYSALAESAIGKIQQVDPNSYLIEVLLGRYAEVKQIYRDAAEHYKRAIEKSPETPDLYYRYAHALWAAGDAQNALPEYKRAIEMNPYDYRALWEQARVQLSDSPEEAIRLSTRALELKPNIAEAYTIRGRALLSLHKPADAVKDLKQAISLEPDNAATHFQLARAYRQMGLIEEAQKENVTYERLEREMHTGKQ
ncbi:MAG: tetratricopeptide repeat protein [Acidobacteriaceae bacterium]|nr:tetratricopeptide repeat protein [Acidobacteriaceae bacterium]